MTIAADSIQREQTDGKGRYIHSDGTHTGEMSYSRLGSARIIIDHTVVPDAFRGQGVGVTLVARAVAGARVEGVEITPPWSFAAAQFRRHPDWHDVLDR